PARQPRRRPVQQHSPQVYIPVGALARGQGDRAVHDGAGLDLGEQPSPVGHSKSAYPGPARTGDLRYGTRRPLRAGNVSHQGKGWCRVDRCALFVDASYALADGAMAVHGTRRRDSVSWNHAGLLTLLAGLAKDRTGLPVLRCYWYETAAEGSRTPDQEALAEMPGLKLRLVSVRPGRREGIETPLRRDLVTLAKNRAISDAFIASADEHLAEIVTEVQDLGLRVVILHISADGGWTTPQPLRQESDDIVEISAVHLRPFVELIRGAEPALADEIRRPEAIGSRVSAADSLRGAPPDRARPFAALPGSDAMHPVG